MAGKLVAAKGKRERRKVDWGELLDAAWGREARQEGEDWERSERLTATRARGYIEEEKENRAPSTRNEEGSEGERQAKSSLGGVCVLSPLLFSQCSKITTPTISSDSLLHVPIPNQDVHYYSTPSNSPRVMTFGGRGRKLFQ